MAEAIISRRGGGGTGLNFKVVGGTSQPTNPRENTIWVNTSTSITSYVFSVTQPAGSAGMVWFKIGTYSSVPFNALKKNTLRVYPTSCKQYVSGSWVDKTAKTYLSSTWTDWWNGELYDTGNQFEYVTGGWIAKHVIRFTGADTNTKTELTIGDTSLSISNSSTIAHTKNKINLTSYKTLTFYGNIVKGEDNNDTAFGVWTEIANGMRSTDNRVAYRNGAVSGSATIDISSLTGEYYVGMYVTDTTLGNPALTCTKMQLK